MSPRNTVGPIAFRYSRSSAAHNVRIGAKQLKCDVPGCNRSASWAGSAMGWDIGSYCTAHKLEMLAVADQALGRETAVAA